MGGQALANVPRKAGLGLLIDVGLKVQPYPIAASEGITKHEPRQTRQGDRAATKPDDALLITSDVDSLASVLTHGHLNDMVARSETELR